ncbi:hypothetical protein Tco_1266173 [Tanacetum coccineum]
MYVGWGVTEWYQEPKIIMVNVIPPDYVDDVPVVEPNQYDDVPVVHELVLVDEDEDSEEDKFEEEEDPQEEEDDMEVDIKEDENEPELTYPYEEMDPLNPPPLACESEPKDAIEVENPIEHEDETVPASVHETAHALVEKKGKAKDKYYGKLILDLVNEVRSSVEQETAVIEKLVEKLGNTQIMPPKFTPLTQAAIRRMIKENVDAAIAAERGRHVNVGNDARGSRPARELSNYEDGSRKLSVFEISKCTEGKKVRFDVATLQGPALTWWNTKVATMGLETVNQMPWTEMKQLMTAEFCLIEEVQ